MIVFRPLTAAVALIALVAASASLAQASEMYTHDAVTLHSGPGERFATVSTLGAGEQITVLWCNSANWCRIQSNLFEGWAPMAQLAPLTTLGAGGNVLNGTSDQAPATGADLSAIVAASPNEAPVSLTGGGTEAVSPDSDGGVGLSLSVGGGSSALSLKTH